MVDYLESHNVVGSVFRNDVWPLFCPTIPSTGPKWILDHIILTVIAAFQNLNFSYAHSSGPSKEHIWYVGRNLLNRQGRTSRDVLFQ
jgi:hypothetical protein